MKFLKIAGVTTIVVIVLGVTLAFARQPHPSGIPWWNTTRNMMQ
jgi:hypothetical protein